MKRKIIPVLSAVCALILLIGAVFAVIVSAKDTGAATEYGEVSITDFGTPVFAGSGASSVDEDTLYYSTANTVGYNADMSSSLFTADYTFADMAFPSWFSITVKASRVDRPYTSDLLGYTFIIKPSGEVQAAKNGVLIASGSMDPIEAFTSYRIALGAVNEGENVRVLLVADGAAVIDYTDADAPYLGGEWINFCGEGRVEAKVRSIKRADQPEYPTYTLNTLQQYPMTTGTSSVPACDDANNLETFDASNCIGFNLHLQNYSFEAKFRFKSFEAGRFGIAMRMSGFNRVHGSDGYAAWFYQYGRVELYRGATLVAAASCVPMEAGRDYIIEMGTVDLNDGRTNIFVSVDNIEFINFIDDTPVQRAGWLNMNAEGNVTFTAASADTKLAVGSVEAEKTQHATRIKIGLINNFSFEELTYAEFPRETVSSILLNGISVYDLNQFCMTQEGERAVDLRFAGGYLEIIIPKDIIRKTGEEFAFGDLRSLEIKKTRNGGGFTAPTGLVLKQSFYKVFGR